MTRASLVSRGNRQRRPRCYHLGVQPSSDSVGDTIAAAIRLACRQAGWTHRELARRLQTNPSAIKRLLALGSRSLDLELATGALRVLGLRFLVDRGGPGLATRSGQHDLVHARSCASIVRRLRRLGFEVRTEVEIGDGRSRGWIDILAYRASDRLLLCIEVKTRLDDVGGVLRSLGWYARSCRAAAERFGWRPRSITPSLLVLATVESDARITASADLLRSHLPGGAGALLAALRDPSGPRPGPSIALFDPRRRGPRWLMRPRMEGGRSRMPYRDYADAARTLAPPQGTARRGTCRKTGASG